MYAGSFDLKIGRSRCAQYGTDKEYFCYYGYFQNSIGTVCFLFSNKEGQYARAVHKAGTSLFTLKIKIHAGRIIKSNC